MAGNLYFIQNFLDVFETTQKVKLVQRSFPKILSQSVFTSTMVLNLGECIKRCMSKYIKDGNLQSNYIIPPKPLSFMLVRIFRPLAQRQDNHFSDIPFLIKAKIYLSSVVFSLIPSIHGATAKIELPPTSHHGKIGDNQAFHSMQLKR